MHQFMNENKAIPQQGDDKVNHSSFKDSASNYIFTNYANTPYLQPVCPLFMSNQPCVWQSCGAMAHPPARVKVHYHSDPAPCPPSNFYVVCCKNFILYNDCACNNIHGDPHDVTAKSAAEVGVDFFFHPPVYQVAFIRLQMDLPPAYDHIASGRVGHVGREEENSSLFGQQSLSNRHLDFARLETENNSCVSPDISTNLGMGSASRASRKFSQLLLQNRATIDVSCQTDPPTTETTTLVEETELENVSQMIAELFRLQESSVKEKNCPINEYNMFGENMSDTLANMFQNDLSAMPRTSSHVTRQNSQQYRYRGDSNELARSVMADCMSHNNINPPPLMPMLNSAANNGGSCGYKASSRDNLQFHDLKELTKNTSLPVYPPIRPEVSLFLAMNAKKH